MPRKLLPKALKRCPKSNKSPNLVTLVKSFVHCKTVVCCKTNGLLTGQTDRERQRENCVGEMKVMVYMRERERERERERALFDRHPKSIKCMLLGMIKISYNNKNKRELVDKDPMS